MKSRLLKILAAKQGTILTRRNVLAGTICALGALIGQPAFGAMTLTQAWSATNNAANANTDISVTWGSARTSGSLLILLVCCDATESTPSGWNLLTSDVHGCALYLFWRISDNSSTDAPTFTSNVSKSIAWAEYTNNTASPADQSTSNGTGTTSAAAWSTGTTGTTAQADELAVAGWGSSIGGVNPGRSWSGETNSFTEVVDSATTKTSGTNVGLAVAVKDLSSTGTVESTATPSGSCARSGVIATFKVAAGGGGASPNRRPANMAGNLTGGFSQ